jgi:two-component system response regulator YesN
MNGQQIVPICNYQNIIFRIEELIEKIIEGGINRQQENMDELEALLRGFEDTDFLKQLAVNSIIKFATKIPACSPVIAMDFLLNLNKQKEHEVVLLMLIKKISEILMQSENITDNFVEKIQGYVNGNLSNPNLTLKFIAEKFLYMNVDYVSRKFAKETGCKFSNYISQQRIQKAKILLMGCNNEKLQTIAEQVGCGDNYQYFSQIFKKYTGMTPSVYAKSVNKRFSA